MPIFIIAYMLVFLLVLPVSNAERYDTKAPSPVVEQEFVERQEWRCQLVGRVKLTAYCAHCDVCDTGWKTADCTRADYRRGIVAADKSVPFGTKLMIDGLEGVYTVRDRGGRVVGNHLDILVKSHWEARKWGVQYRDVFEWKLVSYYESINRSVSREGAKGVSD
jgi:3D (Asp-Asp-Asp) domain-containing protein